MAAAFDQIDTPGDDWRRVDLGAAGDIEVRIIRPQYADVLRDFVLMAGESDGAQYEHRLRTCVADWRGVHTRDGIEVPYSWDNLQKFIQRHPVALIELLGIARSVFRPVTETESKNAESGLTVSSPEVPTNAA